MVSTISEQDPLMYLRYINIHISVSLFIHKHIHTYTCYIYKSYINTCIYLVHIFYTCYIYKSYINTYIYISYIYSFYIYIYIYQCVYVLQQRQKGLFRCANLLSYQAMSSTRTQSQLCTATPILSFVQCQISFWLLPSSVAMFI